MYGHERGRVCGHENRYGHSHSHRRVRMHVHRRVGRHVSRCVIWTGVQTRLGTSVCADVDGVLCAADASGHVYRQVYRNVAKTVVQRIAHPCVWTCV